MNKFSCIDTYYLRASRTIETVLVTNGSREKVFFIYNYEGYHFRVFCSIMNLIRFFSEQREGDFEFGTDDELDAFFENVELI